MNRNLSKKLLEFCEILHPGKCMVVSAQFNHVRCMSSKEELWRVYDEANSWLRSKKLPPDIECFGVFCNNETDLSNVDVYGFDYDYTLAAYKTGVEYLIHDIAKELLVKKFGYPPQVNSLVYDRRFAIRGLHYDVEKGVFLKVDSYNQIQLGTVYRGRKELPEEEVKNLYKRHHLNVDKLFQTKASACQMVHLADIFSKPEMSLIANVIELFLTENLEYEPRSLHDDIKKCVGMAHANFHVETRANPGLFLHRDPALVPFLERFAVEGKKVFLITNSPFETVDAGMSYMVASNWRDLFEVRCFKILNYFSQSKMFE